MGLDAVPGGRLAERFDDEVACTFEILAVQLAVAVGAAEDDRREIVDRAGGAA